MVLLAVAALPRAEQTERYNSMFICVHLRLMMKL